jgi:tetratricopeptide (TPR) repeat protein
MADDTRRFGKVRRSSTFADPLQELRTAIAEIRSAPRDPEPRRYLRALVAEQGTWEQLATLLAEEAGAADDPEVAAALYEQLADVYEDLDQPLEMVAAMEAVVRLEPDDVDQLDRLAWLYHRVGAWARAGETFERVASLAFDVQARGALRAAGQLYRDNSWPDRAAVVYRDLVTRKPGDLAAWQALDEVLTQLGRWSEVAEVRGELVERASGAIDKATLLRAQARAFEQAGDVTRAAELVACAVAHAPEDVSGLVDYAQVLAREGKGHEAADLLGTRIAEAVERGAETEDVAALRLRMVGVLDDVCHDRIAARATLDELLAAAPEHVPALERLVHFAATDPDPRAHPEALLRHAAALYDTDKASLLIEAARKFRELGDHRATESALERAVELVADEELRIELHDARAALDVERAAEEAAQGDQASAENRLRTILETRPHHLEANQALVELLAARGRLDAASEHLQNTLAESPAELAGERLAPLVHFYARVRAQLGDDDEAHQLLHEAHHHDRKSLPITLALGESCFARRLWREAALHLGALATHPDAARHASAVATGLVHAAQAEVRALRPANATKHHEAAVKLDPSCARAWHALAEAALERNDVARAAECLQHEAAATTDPRERVRLFDALGDLMRDMLHDLVRAERCWIEVSSIAPAPLLEKLLAIQRTREPDAARGATCERLAELTTDPAARKQLLDEAAGSFQEAGELPRARGVASRLVLEHPLDETAVTRATAIAIALGDTESTASWLRRALGAWDAAGNRGHGQPNRVELWRRLGDVESARGNAQAALVAYERAVATAPDTSGAQDARRALVDLAGTTGQPAAELLVALVEADPRPGDVLALARELATDNLDDARARFELALALGATLEVGDENLLSTHAVRPMASDEAYGSPLDDDERRAAIDDPDDAPIGELLDLVAEVSAMVLPDARTALGRSDFSGATRLAASSNAAAVAMYPQIAKALGGPPTLLYTANNSPSELSLVLAHPPVVVLGPRLAALRAQSHADAEQTSDAELRFRLGRVVELSRPRRVFTAETEGFTRFIGGLGHAFGRLSVVIDPDLAAEAERLHKIIPMLVRRRISERLAEISRPLDPAAYVAASQRAADRAGLLACGRVDLAIQLAGGPAQASHLIKLAASRGYLAIRKKLRPRRSR